MGWFSGAETELAVAVGAVLSANPFLPERIEHERAALGGQFREQAAAWNLSAPLADDPPNVQQLLTRARQVIDAVRARAARKVRAAATDPQRYEDLALLILYHDARAGLDDLIPGVGNDMGRAQGVHAAFQGQARLLFDLPGCSFEAAADLPHLFAVFFQIRRAFHQIAVHITGRSRAATRLRAAIWQSIFTHDLRRYRRVLFDLMGDVATLVTGPSGTGKELVARAIGLSRYLPFDPGRREFVGQVEGSFHAVNLGALSPALIESELFGHARGAFTGAAADRPGWFESCPPRGSVFLDEIGELEPALQVKLLRVLQTRTFQRLGETTERPFAGKVIAATNRDLTRELAAGRFREDLFYRLCADHVVTPSLREHLEGDPDELDHLVEFIARRLVGEEAPPLAAEVLEWIRTHLPADYPWPGNFRELEQCVRSVMVRREYHPLHPTHVTAGSELSREIEAGALTAEQLLGRYCRLLYERTGSYEHAARRLGLDRRTVKAKIDAMTEERARRRARGGG